MRNQTQIYLDIMCDCEDILKGCIHHLCVTDNLADLINYYKSTIAFLGNIFDIKYSRLTEDDSEQMKEGNDANSD